MGSIGSSVASSLVSGGSDVLTSGMQSYGGYRQAQTQANAQLRQTRMEQRQARRQAEREAELARQRLEFQRQKAAAERQAAMARQRAQTRAQVREAEIRADARVEEARMNRPVEIQPPPLDEDPEVKAILEEAERERDKTLLERDERLVERRRRLREAKAGQRARAAANGVAGSTSSEAVQAGLEDHSERDQAFDDAATETRLDAISQQRKSNLLDVAETRRRAELGLARQLRRRNL